ncbi:MAG: lytic murein transglycosylase [Gammaproteobacteria bacterium]|nr:MAG: lytic murein transglycosylase [Gammaproteobacteria bacterium]
MRFVVFVLTLVCSPFAMGQATEFSQCIVNLQGKAREAGLSAKVVDEVLVNLRHMPRVIEYDRAQPEFTQTFADYLNRRVTPARIDRGQLLLDEYYEFLNGLTDKYGVPGRYLIAFWGLETNFGRYLGKMPTLDSLATLACDERRSDFFTEELLTALSLLQRESLDPEQMQGSWAGAMGHTQFMPSSYYQYAVDGDNNGQVNLWDSENDALASGANFLKHLGWQAGERWGREVLLPDNFPFEESGLNNRRPLQYWNDLGVRLTNKSTLPTINIEAAVIVPAGHTGPAFLVYRNFDVIMRWNRSEYYALAVGLLADRITGAGPLLRTPSTDEKALSRRTIKSMQERLNELGYDAGDPDGVMGPATQSALRAFQISAGLIADGYPDNRTRKALKL